MTITRNMRNWKTLNSSQENIVALIGKTEVREVPHEAGESFTFRYLSGMEIDEAEAIGTEKAIRMVADLKPEMLQTFIDRSTDSSGRSQQQRSNLDSGYVLSRAIVDWTYNAPCNAETITKLDAVTQKWALSVIHEMNTRTPGESTSSDE